MSQQHIKHDGIDKRILQRSSSQADRSQPPCGVGARA
jgi:hypothetical protein